MKTEEVKYVYQAEAPLLVAKTKNGQPVYQETTIKNDTTTSIGKKSSSCWSSHLFSRLRLVLSCLAIVACLAVIVVSEVTDFFCHLHLTDSKLLFELHGG